MSLRDLLSPLTGSFQAKLAAALLGTVALLLGVTLFTVQRVTDTQVDAAVERASEQAQAAFSEWESLRVNELERLARPFTGSIRAAVLLEEASSGGELEALTQEASYELQRAQIDTSLVTFSDAGGTPFFTLVHGRPSPEVDPAGISTLIDRFLDGTEARLHGYRLLDDRLFLVQVEPVYFSSRMVGTVAFGSPVTDADARSLGDVVGAEVCLIVGGECVAGTPGASAGLRSAMVERASGASLSGSELSMDDERWRVVADPLVPEFPDEGLRATAVPLTPVVEPFRSILLWLTLAGVGALGAAVLISLRLSRGLTDPVRKLVAAAHRVEEGDYGAEVQIPGRDEMGRLGAAFNDMTAGLRLKEKYRGVLDKVVSPEVAEELLSGEIELGGEVREATILFADLRGFTALTEDMAPQEVIGFLNQCMERLSRSVEAEGGVIDKYVGDELMALFGAPVSRGNDALAACRAASRMVAAMEEMNRERIDRGEAPVGVGIGLGTGEVVAGNMGTPERLNYTVLGAIVNLAARLCSAAGPGEILISEGTHRAAVGQLEAELLPSVELKGFSRPVEVYQMTKVNDGTHQEVGAESDDEATAPERSGSGLLSAMLAVGTALATGATLVLAAPSSARDGGLPTLQDLGLEYISESGYVQLGFSGRADLEAYFPGEDPAWIIPDTDPFVAPRVRVFADLFVGERFQATAELRLDSSEEPESGSLEGRVDQLFVSFQPLSERNFFVQAGKMPSPFGGYPARHHTVQDPFIRPPLSYDWRSVLPTTEVPDDINDFWERKLPVNAERATGAPIIWGVPYQWGALLTGGLGDFTLRAGAVNSAPAAEPELWSLDSDTGHFSALVAGVSYQATPGLFLDVSWTRGPYLGNDVAGGVGPADRTFDTYDQTLIGIEAVYTRGSVVLRGEYFDDSWELPDLDYEPGDQSWYVEGQVDILPGLYVAGRYGTINFRGSSPEMVMGGGPAHAPGVGWDWDVERIQVATGYRILSNLGIQAEYGWNRTTEAPTDPSDDLAALQLWWSY